MSSVIASKCSKFVFVGLFISFALISRGFSEGNNSDGVFFWFSKYDYYNTHIHQSNANPAVFTIIFAVICFYQHGGLKNFGSIREI